MQKRWNKAKRLRVARLARVSDVDSSFNPTAVGATRACEGDVGKGEMGLLCGASTTRRRLCAVPSLFAPPAVQPGVLGFGPDPKAPRSAK
jgi:hypothetical protein